MKKNVKSVQPVKNVIQVKDELKGIKILLKGIRNQLRFENTVILEI